MPLKELAFFADGDFYTSPCLFIVFKNFRIRFILRAKIIVFLINVKVTLLPQF